MIPTSNNAAAFLKPYLDDFVQERLRDARIRADARTYALWSRRAKLRAYGITQAPIALTRESRRPVKGSAWVPVRVPRPMARLVNERQAARERRFTRRLLKAHDRRERATIRAEMDDAIASAVYQFRGSEFKSPWMPLPDRLPAMIPPPGYHSHMLDASRYAFGVDWGWPTVERGFWIKYGPIFWGSLVGSIVGLGAGWLMGLW